MSKSNPKNKQKDTAELEQQPASATENTEAAVTESNKAVNELQQLQQELETEKARRLQAMADLQNYRRLAEEEKAKAKAAGNRLLVEHILDLLGDLQLAQNDAEMDLERAKSVLGILEDKLITSLHSVGVEKVSLSVGDKFDPTFMEAVTTVPAEREEDEGKVVDVISAAFKYSGKDELLKTAKVVVGKHQ